MCAVPRDCRSAATDLASVPCESASIADDLRAIPDDLRAVPDDLRAVPDDLPAVLQDGDSLSRACALVSTKGANVSHDGRPILRIRTEVARDLRSLSPDFGTATAIRASVAMACSPIAHALSAGRAEPSLTRL